MIFLWPPQFHYHFVGFLVPFLAMSVGLTAARVVQAVQCRARRGWPRPRGRGRSRWRCCFLLAAGVVQFRYETPAVRPACPRRSWPRPAGSSRPAPACSPTRCPTRSLADRFVTSVRGCPEIDDGTGVNYALSHGLNTGTGAAQVPSVAALWHSAFARAQYIWLSVHAYQADPLDPGPAGLLPRPLPARVPGLP